MVQTSTNRYQDRNAPGFMVSAAQERKTESAALPISPQIISLTWGGTDPSVAGNYDLTFPLPSGGTYTLTFVATNIALALEGPALATAIGDDTVLGKLFTASAVGAVVSLQGTSPSIQINVADIVIVDTATTLVAAQTQASGGASLRMGVLYRMDPVAAVGPSIYGTAREPLGGPALRLITGTTLAQIRGMVARELNSTEQDGNFLTNIPDQYTAPDVFPGLLRGVGCFTVDPASAAINRLTAAIYTVIEGGGGGTVVGSLTTVATGNIQIWGGGAALVRPVDAQETPAFGTPQQGLVRCKIDRGN